MAFDHRLMRVLVMLLGVVLTGVAAGFILQLPQALALWPWPDSRLTYVFVGAVAAAGAAGAFWVAYSGELGAAAAIGLNLVVLGSGFAQFLLIRHESRDMHGYVALGIGLVGLGLFLSSRRLPILDPRPAPWLVRLSFFIFVAVLFLGGIALLFKFPNVMPWPLENSDTSVLLGWFFLANGCFFAYSLFNPRWHNSVAQLWSFLVYDLILILPLAARLRTGPPELALSLRICLALMAYSALLAIYYVLIRHKRRR